MHGTSMKNVKKQHLPVKNCRTCGRPFAWRKKWERVWESVNYCSDRCRKNKSNPTSPAAVSSSPN
ncbi:MAG: DUF2256 domain-containing protein [Saprospiraceae bacterium]|nr:DUF2256 domain-containing protein [Saprospiraceae bacterium]